MRLKVMDHEKLVLLKEGANGSSWVAAGPS